MEDLSGGISDGTSVVKSKIILTDEASSSELSVDVKDHCINSPNESEEIIKVNLSGKLLLKTKLSFPRKRNNKDFFTDDKNISSEVTKKRIDSPSDVVESTGIEQGESQFQMQIDEGQKKLETPEKKFNTMKVELELANAFKIENDCSYICWMCCVRFSSGLNAKEHMVQEHSGNNLSAIVEVKSSPLHLQLLLFCPKSCSYCTLGPDALVNHISLCVEADIIQENYNFMDIQNTFMHEKYDEVSKYLFNAVVVFIIFGYIM